MDWSDLKNLLALLLQDRVVDACEAAPARQGHVSALLQGDLLEDFDFHQAPLPPLVLTP